MAGREPHKILMHQGLLEVFKTEFEGQLRYPIKIKAPNDPEDAIYDARQGAERITFEGIPIVVDNTVGEILVQVKPQKYAEKDIVSPVPWSKIMKMKRL